MEFLQTLGLFGIVVGIASGIITIVSYFLVTTSTKQKLLFTGIPLALILIFAGVVSLVASIAGKSSGPQISGTPTNMVTLTSGITATTSITPSPIPSPISTPTSVPALPCIVNVGNWTGGSSDWKTLNGMLLNDGTRFMGTGQTGPTIVAPCQLEGTADYAVEARIQVVSTASYQGGTCFGITVRGVSNTNGWQGYQADVDIDGCSSEGGDARILGSQFPNDFSLARTPFHPGNSWHIYRVEVKGNDIKFLIDGSLVVEVNDNKYLSGGQVGLWSYGVQLNVSSFKVIAL